MGMYCYNIHSVINYVLSNVLIFDNPLVIFYVWKWLAHSETCNDIGNYNNRSQMELKKKQ